MALDHSCAVAANSKKDLKHNLQKESRRGRFKYRNWVHQTQEVDWIWISWHHKQFCSLLFQYLLSISLNKFLLCRQKFITSMIWIFIMWVTMVAKCQLHSMIWFVAISIVEIHTGDLKIPTRRKWESNLLSSKTLSSCPSRIECGQIDSICCCQIQSKMFTWHQQKLLESWGKKCDVLFCLWINRNPFMCNKFCMKIVKCRMPSSTEKERKPWNIQWWWCSAPRWKLESKLANSLPHYGVNKDPVSLHFEEWLFPGAFSCLCYNSNRKFWKSWPQYEVMKMLSSCTLRIHDFCTYQHQILQPLLQQAITQEILKSLPHYQGRSSPWGFATLWFLHLHHFLPSLLQQQDRQFWTNIFSLILVTSALASISPAYVVTTTTTGNSEVFSRLMEWTTIFSLRFDKSRLLQRHQFLPGPPLLQQQHRKVWSRKQTMEWTNMISLRFENLWLLQRHQFLPARLSLLQQQQQQEEILKL